MTLLTNNAEGGSNGTAVTTGNSGGASGTAFTTITLGVGGILRFESAQAAHGTLSYRCINVGTGTSKAAWTISPAASKAALSMYVRFNTAPAVDQFLMALAGGSFNTTAAGKFAIWDSAGLKSTWAVSITAGVWYRLELEMQAGTTTSNGYLAGRYFLGDSTTPAETQYSTSAANTGTGTPYNTATYGAITASKAMDMWMDDLGGADGTTVPIGPAPAAGVFAGWGIPL